MTAKPLPDALPVLAFESAAAFAKWLAAHEDDAGLWLKIAKKDSGLATVTYDEALEAALCHGWIDGQKRAFDDTWFLQRFVPRRAKSIWSKRNIGIVAALEKAGRMRARGRREVELAKADGRWEAAYGGRADIGVPEELARALAADPKAQAFFDALDGTNRFAACFRIATAKKPETRERNAAKFAAMFARGEKLHG